MASPYRGLPGLIAACSTAALRYIARRFCRLMMLPSYLSRPVLRPTDKLAEKSRNEPDPEREGGREADLERKNLASCTARVDA